MGCVQSKEAAKEAAKETKASSPPAAAKETDPAPPAKTAVEEKEATTEPENKAAMAPVVYVVYYSMYGHVKKMADSVMEGLKEAGVDAKIWQVPETLPEEVLGKMHAPPKPEDPVITSRDLPNADGIIFGFPTRFGMMCAQMKAFFDTTGGLWMSGALVGKPASVFFSTGTQAGGQETTALTAVTQLTHHGMMFVPIGYSHPGLQNMEEIHGGSPWGAGCLANGDGSRMPSELELSIAKHQGKHFGGIVSAMVKGRS